MDKRIREMCQNVKHFPRFSPPSKLNTGKKKPHRTFYKIDKTCLNLLKLLDRCCVKIAPNVFPPKMLLNFCKCAILSISLPEAHRFKITLIFPQQSSTWMHIPERNKRKESKQQKCGTPPGNYIHQTLLIIRTILS